MSSRAKVRYPCKKTTYFAAGCVPGDGGRQCAKPLRRELEWVKLGTPFCDLEPIGARSVPAGRGLTTGDEAEIDSGRARVIEGVIQLEGDLRSCSDVDRLGSRAGVVVARHGGGGDSLDWSIVERLPNSCHRGSAASRDGGPYVMGRCLGGGESENQERGEYLHLKLGIGQSRLGPQLN